MIDILLGGFGTKPNIYAKKRLKIDQVLETKMLLNVYRKMNSSEAFMTKHKHLLCIKNGPPYLLRQKMLATYRRILIRLLSMLPCAVRERKRTCKESYRGRVAIIQYPRH